MGRLRKFRSHIIVQMLAGVVLWALVGAVALGLFGALLAGTAGVLNGVTFGAMFGVLGGSVAVVTRFFTGGYDAGMMISRGVGKQHWEKLNSGTEREDPRTR